MPEGRGRVNAAGLGFYEQLVDALLESGIQPMATLYHWDLPAALDDRGGWLNPDVAHWFADYASVMYRALDDRIGMWVTLNEPWVVTDGGYLNGALAPGHRSLYEAADRLASPAARPWRRGAGVSRRRQAPRRPGGQPRTEVRGVVVGRGHGRDPARGRVHEPPVPRPGVPGPVPRRDEGNLR